MRVVRGWKEPSGYGPPFGFRYDGLYAVERYWSEKGKSGFTIWRYRLVRTDDTPPPWQPAPPPPLPPERRESTSQRLVRNSAAVQRVKELHKYQCQVCGVVPTRPPAR